MSEYATSWVVSLLRRFGYRPICRLVLSERPVGEHAANGFAESAMREVKRQTRTLSFALQSHVGNSNESHSISRHPMRLVFPGLAEMV